MRSGSAPLPAPVGPATWRGALAVCLVALAAFATGVRNEPLGDDHLLLSARLGGVTWRQLGDLLSEPYWGNVFDAGLYRPLALIVLAVQKLAFDDSTILFRLVSLALHASCSLVLLAAVDRLHPAAALPAALVFAAHPIHAEAVTTIYGQQDLWAALFFLLAVYLYASRTRSWPLLVSGCYLATLLFKEQGVLLPAVLAVIGVFDHERPRRRSRKWLRPELWLLAPLFAYMALRLNALGSMVAPSGMASVAAGDGPLAWARLVIVSLGTCVRLLVLPTGQTTYYGHLRTSLSGTPWVEMAIVTIAAVIVIALLRGPGRRTTAIAGALGVSTLLPVSNLVPIGIVVAERVLYLPSVGFCLGAGAAWAWWARFGRLAPRVALAAIVAAGVVAGARVAHQWRTPLSHWESTVASHPDSPRAHAMLSLLLLEEAVAAGRASPDDPRLPRAEAAAKTALRLNPRVPEGWRALGELALLRGNCAGAVRAFRQALALRPGDVEVERLLARCQ